MTEAPDSDLFMSRVEALTNGGVPLLSPLAAGILVGVEMGLADSRGFARALGVEHALVLREIALLSSDADGLITVTGRHPKTLRTALELSTRGVALLKERLGIDRPGRRHSLT
jgi:hypothetical protein